MEFISLLTIAKNAGFDFGVIFAICSIAFIFQRFVKNQNAELKKVLNEQVDKIVKAIGTHNERLENLETDMREVKKKLDNVDKSR